MKFGVSVFATEGGLAPQLIAKQAEEMGFESFFVSEHSHIPVSTDFPLADEVPMIYKSMFDPFITLAAAASVTSTIKLGTAICILPQHDPINCAKELATLDQISNGRVVFGVGAGWNPPEMENHGVKFADRFSITKETLEIIKLLWQEEETEYHGKHFDIEKSWMWPKPVQSPHPEVLLAGSGPSILRRAVTLAGGWMPIFAMQWDDSLAGKQSRLESLPEDQQRLRELEQQLGKPRTTISAMGLPPTAQYIDFLMENEVDRMILRAPNEDPEALLETLAGYAELISQY
jgi:probable F420-dependent oxidoreductase